MYELSNVELHMIALLLGCATESEDGRITCSRATLDRLSNLIRYILVPVQAIFVTQKAYAYMFGAVLYRMGMRLVGTAPNFILRPIRPVDVELRDQHACLALRYTDKELLGYGVSSSNVRQWRRQACYIFKDHQADIFARMELQRSRYQAAVRGAEQEHDTIYMFDAVQLRSFVLSRDLVDMDINAAHYIRERELILQSRMSFEPVTSIATPQVISAFWRLINVFLPLAQAIREAMPVWLVMNKDYVAFQEAQLDLCIKNLTLLKEQDLSRNGIRQLTGTPLYILTFEVLLDVAKGVHKLHRIVSTDLKLHVPIDLCEISAWPKSDWLARHGFSPELGKLGPDQR